VVMCCSQMGHSIWSCIRFELSSAVFEKVLRIENEKYSVW
jgi:hypothetical protein